MKMIFFKNPILKSEKLTLCLGENLVLIEFGCLMQ